MRRSASGELPPVEPNPEREALAPGFYARVVDRDAAGVRGGARDVRIEDARLGLRVVVADGVQYDIDVTKEGQLRIRLSEGGTQVVVLPQAANTVHLDAVRYGEE